MGATVRAGEKGTHLVFWSPVASKTPDTITVKDENTGDDVTLTSLKSSRGFYKGFVVFCRDQVDNAPAEEVAEPLTQLERDLVSAAGWLAQAEDQHAMVA